MANTKIEHVGYPTSQCLTTDNDDDDQQLLLVDDETMNYLLSPEKMNGSGEYVWWNGPSAENNGNVVSSDDSSLGSCNSSISSVYSSSFETEENGPNDKSAHEEAASQEDEEVASDDFERPDVSSPPPEMVIISKKINPASTNNYATTWTSKQNKEKKDNFEKAQAPIQPTQPVAVTSLCCGHNDPMQKLAECMERSAMSRSLVETYCQASLKIFRTEGTGGELQQQREQLQQHQHHDLQQLHIKKKQYISSAPYAKATSVTRRRDSVKYPISKQIKSALYNQKKHQFFFGDKYSLSTPACLKGGEDTVASNFRLTGLKFASSEKLMRLDAKLKMLNPVKGGDLQQSHSWSPSSRGNETMMRMLKNTAPVSSMKKKIKLQCDLGDFLAIPKSSFSGSEAW